MRKILMNKGLVLVLMMVGFTQLFGQGMDIGTKNKKAKKYFTAGTKFYVKQDYDNAIAQFKKAISKDKNYIEAYNLLSASYMSKGDITSSIETLRKETVIRPEYPKAWYYLGLYEFKNEEYEKSVADLEKFLTFKTSEVLREGANFVLPSAKFAAEAIKHPVNFNPVNMGNGINSTDLEYWPYINIEGSTFYITRRVNGQEDFYFSKINTDSTWKTAKPLEGYINTSANEGTMSVTPDDKTIYMTQCADRNGCELWISEKNGDKWGIPRNLGNIVNTVGWDAQPTIAPDGKTMYFVSNRAGGLGLKDIWKSVFEDGKWSAPENLGPNINTPYEDEAPFIHFDGQTLYFSSNGHPGFGEKDLFFSRMDENGKFGPAVNLGYPINTKDEEFGMIVDRSGKLAYYSSDRPEGFGGLDIYKFDLPEEATALKVSYVRGLVYDSISKKKLTSQVSLVDLETGKVVQNVKTNEGYGDFLVVLQPNKNYGFNVNSDGYLFFSENFKLTESSFEKPLYIEAALKKPTSGQSLVLKNTFFETDKATLKSESFTELKKVAELMSRFPNMKVELAGHTDNVGADDYNLKLSQGRAESVKKYLMELGVDGARMVAKGYGETKPIATNDSEKGRALNRRTEFVVLSN